MLDTARTLPFRLRFELPEFRLPATLPSESEALERLLIEQHRALEELQAKALEHFEFLYEQIALMRRRQFGASSEQMPGQPRLFDEAEALAASGPAEDSDQGDNADEQPEQSTPAATKRARGKRAMLPPELPRVEIVHDVPEADRVCACGTPMAEIGEDVSEQLDIVPMKIQVLRHIRKRYGCPGGEHAPVTAQLPAQPLPKTNASPDLLAMLLTTKYVDGLPLARFEHVLGRSGVSVPRQTLARWAIGSAGLLQPVLNLLRDELFDGPFVHMDETVIQVLKERDRPATSNSYMWVQTGGPPGRPVVIYDYDPSRSGEVPRRLLAGYSGYLMTDGYEGYNALVEAERIEHIVCWAHCRRGFVEAARLQPKGKKGRADQAIEMIGRLYRVEREAAELGLEQRLEMRLERSKPLLHDLRDWLDRALPAAAPKTALGKALAYMHKYWPRLIRYVERGDLPIDNNRAENAIRPFVVGRKAWLFSDTPAGAHASALIYSLVQTAKANRIDPYLWLRVLMRRLPTATSVENLEALMPWNLHPDTLSIPFHG